MDKLKIFNDAWNFIKENTPPEVFHYRINPPSPQIIKHNFDFLSGRDRNNMLIDFSKIKFEGAWSSLPFNYEGDELTTIRFFSGILDFEIITRHSDNPIISKGCFCICLEHSSRKGYKMKCYEVREQSRLSLHENYPKIEITEENEVIILDSGSSTKGVK